MSPLHTLAPVPAGGVLEDALAASLAGASFVDTAFHAPTRRGPSTSCRAIGANSHILKAVSPYFNRLLSGGSSRERGQAARLSDDEDDDSDIEDDDELPVRETKDEDDEDDLKSFPSTPSDFTLSEFEAIEELPANTPTADKTNDLTAATNHPKEASSSALCDAGVVHLDSVAADTLEAAIFYLYTGNVYFLPLRSRGAEVRQEALSKHHKTHAHRPACSPKSMYRFACEAELDELKALAEAHLFAQLDKENILPELFSRFSARHPEILQRQAALLLRDYWTPAARAALAPLMERVVQGKMPHAAPALMLLLCAIPEAIPEHKSEELPRKDADAAAQEGTATCSSVAASNASLNAIALGAPERRKSAVVDTPSACAAQGAARTATQGTSGDAKPHISNGASARAEPTEPSVSPTAVPPQSTTTTRPETVALLPVSRTSAAAPEHSPTPSARASTVCASTSNPAPPASPTCVVSSTSGETSASSMSGPVYTKSKRKKRSEPIRMAAEQPADASTSLDKVGVPQDPPITIETSRGFKQRVPPEAGSDWFPRLIKKATEFINPALEEGNGTASGAETKGAPATTDPVANKDSRATGKNNSSANATAPDANAAELLPPLHVNPWEKYVRAQGGQEPDR